MNKYWFTKRITRERRNQFIKTNIKLYNFRERKRETERFSLLYANAMIIALQFNNLSIYGYNNRK